MDGGASATPVPPHALPSICIHRRRHVGRIPSPFVPPAFLTHRARHRPEKRNNKVRTRELINVCLRLSCDLWFLLEGHFCGFGCFFSSSKRFSWRAEVSCPIDHSVSARRHGSSVRIVCLGVEHAIRGASSSWQIHHVDSVLMKPMQSRSCCDTRNHMTNFTHPSYLYTSWRSSCVPPKPNTGQ